MMDVEKLYDELKIEENAINIRFSVEGHSFWISKGNGLLRKKLAATKFLSAFSSDEIGAMTGKYDEAIEHMMTGVTYYDDQKAVDISGSKYWDWLAGIPEVDENGNPVQLTLMSSLPQAVAAVILGKPQMQALIRQSTILNESIKSQESLNTTNEDRPVDLKKKSKEPVRNLPKHAKSSG